MFWLRKKPLGSAIRPGEKALTWLGSGLGLGLGFGLGLGLGVGVGVGLEDQKLTVTVFS